MAERGVWQRTLADKQTVLAGAIETRKTIEEASGVSQACAREVQGRLGLMVGGLVTECLKGIIPGFNMVFMPVFETKRNQTECSFILTDGNGNRYDPVKCNGGGVCDIIAFALRVCVLLLESKPHRNVLILDEPFKFLHGSVQQDRAFETLMKIAERLNMQIIVVNQDALTDTRSVSHEIARVQGKSYIINALS
jgi:hypothetical protein